jgi:transcriptional regulator with XRE-family HTH domain
VRDSRASGYALSRQIGISESALSRFLSGQRGLALSVLDRLADVLGLQISITVQKVPRPVRRGRKRKGALTMTATVKDYWHEEAKKFAKEASENHFSSRRGVWLIKDARPRAMCIYNNNPYAKDPARRDEETKEFRAWLKRRGLRELAYTTYPESGEDAGYTYAMIVESLNESVELEIAEKLREIIEESHRRLLAAKKANNLERSGRGMAP